MTLNTQINLDSLLLLQRVDRNATINQLKYLLFLANTEGALVPIKSIVDYFGMERHTNNKILTRLLKVDFIEIELEYTSAKTQRRKVRLTEKGIQFCREMSC